MPLRLSSLLLSLFLVTVSACGGDRPDDILPEAEMEAVLYDYHMAEAMAQTAPDSIAYHKWILRREVLAAHGLTEEKFQASLRWYSRHSEKLYAIYGRLAERLNGAPVVTSGTPSTAQGDTLTLWQGKAAYLLAADAQNYMTFTLSADTTLRSGDLLTLRLSPSWMYSEGSRSAVAALSVKYAGDSVVSSTAYLSSQGHVELSLNIADKPVTSVSAFVYQTARPSERPKLLILNRPVLLRSRNHTAPASTGDSLTDDNSKDRTVNIIGPKPEKRLRDSLLRDDTIRRRRPHFQ